MVLRRHSLSRFSPLPLPLPRTSSSSSSSSFSSFLPFTPPSTRTSSSRLFTLTCSLCLAFIWIFSIVNPFPYSTQGKVILQVQGVPIGSVDDPIGERRRFDINPNEIGEEGKTIVLGDSIFSGAANLASPQIKIEPLVKALRTLVASYAMAQKGHALNPLEIIPNYAQAGARILPHSYFNPGNEDIAPRGVPSPIHTQYDNLSAGEKKGYQTILMDGGGNDILASLNLCFNPETNEVLDTCNEVLDSVMRGIEVLWTKIGEDQENEIGSILYLGYYYNGLVDPLIDIAMEKLTLTCKRWNESIEEKNKILNEEIKGKVGKIEKVRKRKQRRNLVKEEVDQKIGMDTDDGNARKDNTINNNVALEEERKRTEIDEERLGETKAAIEPIGERGSILDGVISRLEEDQVQGEGTVIENETEIDTELEAEAEIDTMPNIKVYPKCYIVDPRDSMSLDLISFDRIHPTWEGSVVLANLIFDEAETNNILL